MTTINSRGAVWRARKLAKLRGKRLLLLARCCVSKFGSLLSEFSTPAATWKRVSG